MGKKVKGKEKQAEEKKTAEKPKEENRNVSATISAAPVQIQKQVDGVREESELEQESDMTAMGQSSR